MYMYVQIRSIFFINSNIVDHKLNEDYVRINVHHEIPREKNKISKIKAISYLCYVKIK